LDPEALRYYILACPGGRLKKKRKLVGQLDFSFFLFFSPGPTPGQARPAGSQLGVGWGRKGWAGQLAARGADLLIFMVFYFV